MIYYKDYTEGMTPFRIEVQTETGIDPQGQPLATLTATINGAEELTLDDIGAAELPGAVSSAEQTVRDRIKGFGYGLADRYLQDLGFLPET